MAVENQGATKKFNNDPNAFLNQRLDAQEVIEGLRQPNVLEDIVLPEDELITDVGERAQELMAGKLPDDVQTEITAQIEQLTAERSLAGGLGLGQAGLNLQYRDLGANVADVANAGTQLAFQVGGFRTETGLKLAALNSERQRFNEDLGLRFQAFEQGIRQWDDKFNLMMQESNVNVDRIRLAAHELISRTQSTMQSLINDIVIHNSTSEIKGASARIDAINEFFNTSNTAILEDILGAG